MLTPGASQASTSMTLHKPWASGQAKVNVAHQLLIRLVRGVARHCITEGNGVAEAAHKLDLWAYDLFGRPTFKPRDLSGTCETPAMVQREPGS